MFKDSENKLLFQFDRKISVESTVDAGVLALRKGLPVAVASQWASMHFFVFESNCKSIVAWVTNPLSGTMAFAQGPPRVLSCLWS